MTAIPPSPRPPRVIERAWPFAAPLPADLAGAVVAIGSFDGVHLGHRVVLDRARRLADDLSRPLVALTFEPHPRSYFNPAAPVFRLSPLREKARLLARAGADATLAVSFDSSLAGLSAGAFVDELLLGACKVGGVVVGHDFHFGKGRAGDTALLEARLAAAHASLVVVPAFGQGAEIVASRSIRAALERGDIAAANRALGHPWFVVATVEHGDKRGRDLGFPTANLHLSADCRLRHGIYAVRAIFEGRAQDGVASFGRRPTFDDGRPKLEVFLFDFAGDLYGREIEVAFHGWIRGEEKFASVEALVAQMRRDCEAAKRLLEAGP